MGSISTAETRRRGENTEPQRHEDTKASNHQERRGAQSNRMHPLSALLRVLCGDQTLLLSVFVSSWFLHSAFVLSVSPWCAKIHRSSSAAMIFRLPSTATTSLSVWPRISLGNRA